MSFLPVAAAPAVPAPAPAAAPMAAPPPMNPASRLPLPFSDRPAELVANVYALPFTVTPERARKELGLQVTLAFAFMCTLGYAAPETGANMGRARELCQHSRDQSSLCPILWGLWAYYLCQGDMKSAREAGEHMLSISSTLNDPVLLVGSHNALAMSRLHQGELVASRQHFDEVIKLYDVTQHGRYLHLYSFDPAIHAAAQMVRLLWLLGYPDQARRKVEETLVLARTLSSPLSLAFCEIFAAQLYQNLHWPEKTKEHGQACIAI